MIIERIALGLIDPPATAHRLSMDEHALWELADSIRLEGLHNPISVRPREGGRYEIIAGHRRWCASKIAGLMEIECLVRASDDTMTEIERTTENLQRENLTPMEEAITVTRLANATQAAVPALAAQLHRSETWVRQRLELMQITDELKEAVHTRQIATKTALHLAAITDDDHRRYLLTYAISSGASAQVIRAWVDEWKLTKASGVAEPAPLPPMGEPGQPVIIMIPCLTCGEATDHRAMYICRLCKACHEQIVTT